MISHLMVHWPCATPRGGLALEALSSSIRGNSNPSATQTLMRRSVKWPADSSATQGWRASTWLQGELCNIIIIMLDTVWEFSHLLAIIILLATSPWTEWPLILCHSLCFKLREISIS